MAGKPNAEDTELKLQLTSLIDVTFLILIFLMVLPFKTLTRKVEAFLPKDRGIDNRPIKLRDRAKMTVALRHGTDASRTRVKLLDTPLGDGPNAFVALDRGIAEIHGRSAEVVGEIDASADVPHGDVIRALDSFLKAGVSDVTFIGAPEPGR